MNINNLPPPMQIKQELKIDHESPLWKAAEGIEANFLREMMKNMRKTVQESPEMENSPGYKMFREMLDGHYADTAAHTQGIGLAEIIVKQVMEMHGAPRPMPRTQAAPQVAPTTQAATIPEVKPEKVD